MRDDEDNIRQYMPVLRRIIILVAVLTAIPVVMWTLTAVVRTYVGPPQGPTYQPMAASKPASGATQQTSEMPPNSSATASVPTAAPVGEAPLIATDAVSAAPAPAPTKALLPADGSTGPMPPDAASQNPAPGAATLDAPQTAALVVPNAPSAEPNPVPSPGVVATPSPTADDDAQIAPQQQVEQPQQQVAAQQPDAANWPAPPATADTLPQDVPIAGPVPLPRKRPRTFVLAQSAVPLPVPRPETAGAGETAPAPTPLDWLHHLFQPSAGAASPPAADE